MHHLNPTATPALHASTFDRAEAWALLVRAAAAAVERPDDGASAALAAGVGELERALGIALDGPDPAPAVTARRLARVQRAELRSPGLLGTSELVRVARQVTGAPTLPPAVRSAPVPQPAQPAPEPQATHDAHDTARVPVA